MDPEQSNRPGDEPAAPFGPAPEPTPMPPEAVTVPRPASARRLAKPWNRSGFGPRRPPEPRKPSGEPRGGSRTPPGPRRFRPPVIAAIAVAAAAVLVTGATVVIGASPEASLVDGAPATGDTSITDAFDPKNTSLYLPRGEVPVTKVTVRDGVYADDAGHELTLDSEPVFADLDGDGDRDAAAIYHFSGYSDAEYSPWRGVYVWLWEDGAATPLRWRASSQKDCVKGTRLDIAAAKEGLSVTRAPRDFCKAASDLEAQKLTVAVRDRTPVRVSDGHLGAVERCHRWKGLPDERRPEVTGEVEPVLLPTEEAASVGDGVDAVDVYLPKRPEDSLIGGHLIAVVSFGDTELCGWLSWKDVEAAS